MVVCGLGGGRNMVVDITSYRQGLDMTSPLCPGPLVHSPLFPTFLTRPPELIELVESSRATSSYKWKRLQPCRQSTATTTVSSHSTYNKRTNTASSSTLKMNPAVSCPKLQPFPARPGLTPLLHIDDDAGHQPRLLPRSHAGRQASASGR